MSEALHALGLGSKPLEHRVAIHALESCRMNIGEGRAALLGREHGAQRATIDQPAFRRGSFEGSVPNPETILGTENK
jgi:hypothetical protein